MNFLDSVKSFWKKHIKNRLSARAALLIVMGCCLVSLLLQYFQREDAVSPLTIAGVFVVPFQQSVNTVGGFLSDTEEKRRSLDEALAEIESLEEENSAYKRQIEEQSALVKENEELRSLLRAKERLSDYDMIEATVIGNDGTNIFERITIDRGSLDGLKVNMNVINGDGLIGYICEVGLNYSVVTCIIEDGINVSVMTKNGHKNCILTGKMELADQNLLYLDNALSSIDFTADGTLVTSTISDRYLPNLLVGYVTGTEVNGGDLTQSGTVKCAVDFTNLKEVMVITTMKEEAED